MGAVCTLRTAAAPQGHRVRGEDTAPACGSISSTPGVHRCPCVPQAQSVTSSRAGSCPKPPKGVSQVQSCTAHSTQGEQTAHINGRHKDAGKEPSSGFGGLLPSQVLSPCSSPLSEGLSQDPYSALSPILLLWVSSRESTVLTCRCCRAAHSF